MPWKSRWQIDLPILSLSSYLFRSPTAQLENKPILIDAEKPQYHLTHHSYREWSKRFAAGLRKAGLQPGDRLLLYSGNNIFFPVVFQGTVMAGGILTAANPGYVARELAYQLQDSGATFVVTNEGSLGTALEAIESVGFPREKLFVMGAGMEVFEGEAGPVKGVKHWSSLLASAEEGRGFRWEEFTEREQMDRTVVINYSSGTTGVPKGVEITHLNYVANCTQTDYMARLDPDYEGYLSRAVGLSFLPMYHAYGQTYHCVTTVTKGIPVYVMRGFDFIKMLQYIEKYRVSSLTLVPPIAVALTKRPEVRKYDLSSVEAAGCGAAPLSPETIRDFETLFGNRFQLKQGWGMTEITCSACGWDPNVMSEAVKVGELNPNIEAMMVDEEGKEVGDGERGEFLVRGPNVMKGYWRKPEATAETKTMGGWLRTGDIAVKFKDGCLSIVDRKKELIKVKGNQVAPAELEGLLLDHPAVQDAAVVGVVIGGEELPRAYVVLQADANAAEAEPKAVAAWLAEKVARHKRLVGGVVVTDAIPKNPSGKILRKLLRERAKEEVGDKEAAGSRL